MNESSARKYIDVTDTGRAYRHRMRQPTLHITRTKLPDEAGGFVITRRGDVVLLIVDENTTFDVEAPPIAQCCG